MNTEHNSVNTCLGTGGDEMYNYSYNCSDDGYYTDMAIERRRADLTKNGIEYTKELCPAGYWERINVKSESGAESIGRPCGRYDTLTTKRLDTLDEDALYDAQEEVAKTLCKICDDIAVMPARILIIGLGNEYVTADSIGVKCAAKVKPTMHIRCYDEEFFDELECSEIAVLCPGVSAKTGMDSTETAKAICSAISPDIVIAIDSLSTRSRKRLGTTLQISDTGIFPGGVGNLKSPLTRPELGVPVIGIGVPTVMDTRLFINKNTFSEFDFEPLFVSPREIDEITDAAATVIAGAINQAFGLSY